MYFSTEKWKKDHTEPDCYPVLGNAKENWHVKATHQKFIWAAQYSEKYPFQWLQEVQRPRGTVKPSGKALSLPPRHSWLYIFQFSLSLTQASNGLVTHLVTLGWLCSGWKTWCFQPCISSGAAHPESHWNLAQRHHHQLLMITNCVGKLCLDTACLWRFWGHLAQWVSAEWATNLCWYGCPGWADCSWVTQMALQHSNNRRVPPLHSTQPVCDMLQSNEESRKKICEKVALCFRNWVVE